MEGAPKLFYASISPLNLSLFLLERKLTSLQGIFFDALDVEENFRLSGKVLDHGCANENGEELDLVEMHEIGEKFPRHLALSSDIWKEDQPRDKEAESFISPFLGNRNHPVPSSIRGGLKKDYSMPIYDEFEDDYWGGIPGETVIYPVR